MKHLKTSLQDLHDLFSQNIPVRYVAEPIASFDDSAPCGAIRSFMSEHDYDVVGVRRAGIIVGYVRKSDLADGNLDVHIINFLPDDLIDETDPLITAFSSLRKLPQLFVRTLGHVGGIVTRGDMQKAPVRMWLFGLISLIELQLLRLIREGYPGDTWKQYLSEGRLASAQKLLAERQRRNEAIDLADCLQFCDKRDIVLKSEKLRTSIGCLSKTESKAFLVGLEELRDNLAHSQDIITGQWPRTADLAQYAASLLQQCEEVTL